METSKKQVDYYFPFHRFNLRKNPFGTLAPDECFDVVILPPAVEAALQNGFDHLLVLGDKGRGKSTTLHYLRYHFAMQEQQVGYERLPRWHWRYTTDTTLLDVFALDEAQRLAVWEMWRLFRERERYDLRLIVGSHRDHTWEFQLRGLNVVTVRLEQEITRTRLEAILARRLTVFAYNGEPLVYFAPDAVDYLWQHFRDDLRSMNSFLYDVFQRLDHAGAITASMLYPFSGKTSSL